jgi:hypothetical protein
MKQARTAFAMLGALFVISSALANTVTTYKLVAKMASGSYRTLGSYPDPQQCEEEKARAIELGRQDAARGYSEVNCVKSVITNVSK